MCWFASNRFRLARLWVCNRGSESEDVDLECRRRSRSNPPIPESSPQGMDYSQEIPGKVNRFFGNYRYVSATTITGQVLIMTGLPLDRKFFWAPELVFRKGYEGLRMPPMAIQRWFLSFSRECKIQYGEQTPVSGETD